MYNGIGLATVRGSGTNGYVTKNLSHVSRVRVAQVKSADSNNDFGAMKEPRAPNLDIIDHNRKREVELKVLRLRDALEEQGVARAEIEEKASELRRSLLAKLPPLTAASGSARPGETHADAATKQQENAALKQALGIGSDYVGGSAYDQDLQARRKEERLAKRAAEEEEVATMEAALEQEKEREERARRKEARKAEKEERKKQKRDQPSRDS